MKVSNCVYLYRFFREKFGLHYVDFNDPERPRTPKASAAFYNKLAVDNGFVDPSLSANKTHIKPQPVIQSRIKARGPRGHHQQPLKQRILANTRVNL